ncbi:cyclase family protein [Aromatoleum buckelii]|uniref:Cyclase family protein n=1 Tax=Aromatoleum buckelii TaxID=200254 RepID=A0ABX1N6P3_9RHOO|nr:cyclase family protein [Aromatoleum buckelii]MCK0511648.1 cyclase family protein [Aromatoleum buckelii]
MSSNGNVLTQLVDALAAGSVKVVDLTQPLGPDTPVLGLPEPFSNSPPVTFETISHYDDQGPAWYWRTIRMGEHTGTHFDAPVHWISGKDRSEGTVDTIPARRLVGPACVIDISREAAANADHLLTRDALLEWESRHGRIPPNAWVLLRSDWSKRVGAAEFLNCREDGPHSPGFDRGATELLALERDVLGVGVETVGTDAGQAHSFDPPFWTHHIMQGNGKFGLASLCNLDQLPPTGAVLVASPLKLVDGSGSPLRVLALVPA